MVAPGRVRLQASLPGERMSPTGAAPAASRSGVRAATRRACTARRGGVGPATLPCAILAIFLRCGVPDLAGARSAYPVTGADHEDS